MCDGCDGGDSYGEEFGRGSIGGGRGGCLVLIIMLIMAIVGVVIFVFSNGDVGSNRHTYKESGSPYEHDYPEPDYPEPPPDYYDNWDY